MCALRSGAGDLGFVENGRGFGDPSHRQSAQQQCPESLVGVMNGKREDRKFSRKNQASPEESVS